VLAKVLILVLARTLIIIFFIFKPLQYILIDLNVWLQELTKEAIMELARNEQLKERHEMEKKLQKFAKTMDYLERAKRQEEAPLIEQAFQKRLEEEKILHEQEQLVSFLLFFCCFCRLDNCQCFINLFMLAAGD
jgi:hypothetical protein